MGWGGGLVRGCVSVFGTFSATHVLLPAPTHRSAEGDGDGAGAADGDGVYSLVGLYERRNPLKVPRALRETRESRGLRAGHVSRAVMTRREGPAVEADETYRNRRIWVC